jgi:signal transduction histidine kinase
VAERLRQLVAEYQAGGEGSIKLVLEGDVDQLGGPVGEAVFRVAQESLTNVRKHARGADVSMSLRGGRQLGDDVVLVVADESGSSEQAGHSAELAGTGGGFGIRGMRERAELLGGTLTAGANGHGWRVELRLPVAGIQQP